MALDPITAGEELLNGFGTQLLQRIWPDPAQRVQGEMALAKMKEDGEMARLTLQSDLIKGQLAINQAEAQSASLFISGPRPFILWCCGLELAVYILGQMVNYFVHLFGYKGDLPLIDMSVGVGIMSCLLGTPAIIGRTMEKLNKADRVEPDH